MSNPHFYAAVYAIIRDNEGKILFSQRKNTGFMDGKFQLPAGHIEGEETMKQAVIRELSEEIAITVAEEDVKIRHVSHRISLDERVYFDVYAEVSHFTGTPRINEPEKCSDLRYFDLDTLDRSEFVGYDLDVIRMSDAGERFSEMNMCES